MTAEELTPLIGLALSVGLAYACTPIAIRAAHRFEFYDHPVGYKGHLRPTPYLGGAAVVAAFLVVVLLLATDSGRALPLTLGVLLLWAIGTIDDRRAVAPLVRVVIEIGVATALWGLGYGWDLGLGSGVDLAITIAWIVGVVNAFNLFDNMDGAASSMASIVAAGIATLGVAVDDTWLTVTGAALCGACLGFLPHNLSTPAKVFLGDGGSMPLGFAVATLTMMGASTAEPSWQALAIGVLIVGIPALDTCLVVVSRTRRGISVTTGGRDHLTHRARQRFQTVRGVVLALGAAQVGLAALAVTAVWGGSNLLAGAMFVYLVAVIGAVFVLDGRPGAPLQREGDTLALPERGQWRMPGSPPRTARAGSRPGNQVIVGSLGLLAGLSPFFQGLYNSSDWAPVGIVIVVASVAAVLARPFRPSNRTTVLVAAVAGLGLLTLLSATWAPATERAVADADRVFLYATLLVLLLVLVRDDRSALVGVAGAFVGGLVVSIYLAIQLVSGDGAHLFVGTRLDEPLNYINGQGTALLLTFFPAFALAEQRRYPALAGTGAAAAMFVAGLALMTQSRGVALASIIGLLLLVAVVPGRAWRLGALGVLAVGVAVSGPTVLDVSASGGGLSESAQSAALLLLAVTAATGVVWGSITAAAARVKPALRMRVLAGWKVTLAVVVTVAAGAALVNAGDVVDGVEAQYDAFIRLEGSADETSGARLLSGGGNRYDYWLVAMEAWEGEPVWGLGAGGYQVPYFRERSTAEDIRQPHSLPLQTLAELGLLGLALLLVAAIAIVLAVRAQLRFVGQGWERRTLMVAALGSTAAWATHSSVDWPHLLPGVTAVALVSIAVLFRPPRRDAEPALASAPRSALRRAVPAVAMAAFVALAGFSLSRQVLVDHYRSEAEAALSDDRPSDALEQADRAIRLAPDDIDSYFARAAAYARFNDADSAQAALEDAIEREPTNFVAWTLLGDLQVRLGSFAAAGRAYREASALNPRDPELAQLAADPRAALRRLEQ